MKFSGSLKCAITIVLFSTLLALFFISPIRTSYDSRWSIHTAMSLIRGNWGALNEYMPIVEQEKLYAIQPAGDRYYNLFPLGSSILAVPVVAVASAVYPDYNERLAYAIPIRLEVMVASIVGAAAGAIFFWLIYGRFENILLALLATFILCLCTSVWSVATRGLWQHGPAILMFVVAMLLLERASRRSFLAQYASLPLAMSFIIRPTAAIEIVILSVYVLVIHREWFVRYMLWAAVVAAPWFTYNWVIYNFPVPPYYLPSRIALSDTFSEALIGNLLSPARGLFVYSPVLILAVAGLMLALRERKDRPLHLAFAIIIPIHWIVISRFPHWWAGHSYGPRFMADILPFMVYFVAFALHYAGTLNSARRAAFMGVVALLSGVSFFMHAQGALDFSGYAWNADPVSVDEHPERLWDWRDPPFLR